MAAARAAAEAALYETTTQEMTGQQYHSQHQPFFEETYTHSQQQERGYLETLQQHSEHLGVQADLLQDFLGSSNTKNQSANELLHLLAQQQGQQNSMQNLTQNESVNLKPEEHYMTIAQDGMSHNA